MGNQLLKVYHVDKESELEGGRFLRWKILQAVHKDRHHQTVTLFVFDKKLLDRYERISVRDALLDSLRRDATKLQKLRHPNLLHILEPLSEERSSLAFATKPVLCSLHQYTQLSSNSVKFIAGGCPPSRSARDGSNKASWRGGGVSSDDDRSGEGRREGAGGEQGGCGGQSGGFGPDSNMWAPMCLLEKKCGLLDIAEAIAFLHQDAKLVHRNVNPNSVFITTQGKWLLGGMSYSVPIGESQNNMECDFSFSSSGGSVHDVGGVSLDPPLMYSAPEVTKTYPGRCTTASDMYSFGLLIYELLSEGNKPLINVAHYDVQAHYPQCKNALPFPAHSIPTGLQSSLSAVLSLDPSERPSIQAFLQAPFFQDINVRALRFLETLREKDDTQKIQFLQGLTGLLEDNEDFDDNRLLRERVLTPLLDVLPFSSLYPHVLPNLFVVLKKVTTPQHFQDVVWPTFRPLLTAKEIQIESVLIIIRELDFILTLCTDEMTNNHFLPLVLKCLEMQQPHIQELVLAKLTTLSKRFDYSILRNSVLPRVLHLLVNAESSRVRVCGLQAVTLVSASFDRPTILEQIIPAIEKVNKVDRAALVCMAVAHSLESLAKHLGNKLGAERILPVAIPLLVEENLTAEQFTQILTVVKNMIRKIEETRLKDFQIATQNSSAVTDALGAKQDAGSFEVLLLANQGLKTSNAPISQPPPPQPTGWLPQSLTTSSSPTPAAFSHPATLMGSSDPLASFVSSTTAAAKPPPAPPAVRSTGGVHAGPACGLTPLPKLLAVMQTSSDFANPSVGHRTMFPSAGGNASSSSFVGPSGPPLSSQAGGPYKPNGPSGPTTTTGQVQMWAGDNLGDLFSTFSSPSAPSSSAVRCSAGPVTLNFSEPSAVASPSRLSADPFAGLSPGPCSSSLPTAPVAPPPAMFPRPPPPHPNVTSLPPSPDTAMLSGLFAGVVPPPKRPPPSGDPWGGLDILK
eukprot:GHVS01064461.1.p1 GENE.GHVS01064461.1~~GHVS01064461.1.p1  ORF type:complete len:965 (-),score=138.48 GHVS01064461.1:245-3139(-)